MQKFLMWFAAIVLAGMLVLNVVTWDFTPVIVVLACGFMFILGGVSLGVDRTHSSVAWALILAPVAIGALSWLEIFHPDVPVLLLVLVFTGLVAMRWWASKFKEIAGW